MKRGLWILAVLSVGVVVVTGYGQAPGPGNGGATLKLSGFDPVTPEPNTGSRPAMPEPLKGLWNENVYPANSASSQQGKIAIPFNRVDINRDIEVTPAAGNWLIFAMAYTGPKAPEMARKFVIAMRGYYKWNAYVFNYGAEEKRKEYERVRKIILDQKNEMLKAGLKDVLPIHVPMMRIDEQTGVLVGGFKTRGEAMAALKTLTKLDPRGLIGKVDLDVAYVAHVDPDRGGKGVKLADSESAYVNPFLKAFPVRNPHPDMPKEKAGPTSEEDMKFLRHVNREEPYTLLQCKKPWTLAIKQFNMRQTMANDKKRKEFLDKFEAGYSVKGGEWYKKGEWEDLAAQNAHNLAEGLRKQGLEAYVLHAKYCSYVTIGSFDGTMEQVDPRMLAMQSWLQTHFNNDAWRPLELLPQPMPMPVPH